ncbi:MAG: GNAT family N-acetyltransferase [Clostridiales bacterium]|jgi:ribosomal protein S18 acetylase RimI-like enzyme|nr:GNAT family N-acetyltransferase [Clostridiales bacterium]
MRKLIFTQLKKDDMADLLQFESVFFDYDKEQREHGSSVPANVTAYELAQGMLNMQGPSDRHLELCYDGGQLTGFLYGKVDHEGHKGFIKPGFGYIMEFYVRPEYRRQGYGKAMFRRLESLFALDGADRMYLNADAVTGVPFWTAMGFAATGEISPDNHMVIYERSIDKLNILPMQTEHIDFVYGLISCDYNKAALHGADMTLDDWTQICRRNLKDPDEANFIIFRGFEPVAWLKINGLQGGGPAWISMLVVREECQHRGIGSFAVTFAEDFVKAKGFQAVGIHTTVDNIPAQNLYKKQGYVITEEREYVSEDGKKRRTLTFYRDWLDAVRICIDGAKELDLHIEYCLDNEVKIYLLPVGNIATRCPDIVQWAENWDWNVGKSVADRLRHCDYSGWECAFVAIINGQYAGFCHLKKKDEYGMDIDFTHITPFIGAVYVDPQFRGRRVSENLVKVACDYACSCGFSAVYLISSHVGLYEKYGFKEYRQIVTRSGSTEMLFQKELL